MDGLVIGNTKIFILIFIQLITEVTSCGNCQNMCVCVLTQFERHLSIFSPSCYFIQSLPFKSIWCHQVCIFVIFCIFAFLHFCIFRFLHICIFAFCSGWVHLSSHLIHLIITGFLSLLMRHALISRLVLLIWEVEEKDCLRILNMADV